MKLLLAIVGVLVTQLAVGQNIVETRTATLMDGDYSLQGTVYLELFDDGSLDLRFGSDYLTNTNVFDVHVFLTNSSNYASPIDTSGMLLVENIGTETGLDYSSGARTFNLPSGVGINDYQNILFVCVKYGQLHWGDGSFGGSIVSSISDTEDLSGIAIYPNPSSDGNFQIELNEPQEDLTIELLDLNGRLVGREQQWGVVSRYQFRIEETGTYLLKLTTRSGSVVKKVVLL